MTKVVIDTNYIVRFLSPQKNEHFKEASDLFYEIQKEKIIGYVNICVIHESFYVLKIFYKVDPIAIKSGLSDLLNLKNIKVIEYNKKDVIEMIALAVESNLDFTDAVVLFNSKQLGAQVKSFDKKVTKLAKG